MRANVLKFKGYDSKYTTTNYEALLLCPMKGRLTPLPVLISSVPGPCWVARIKS